MSSCASDCDEAATGRSCDDDDDSDDTQSTTRSCCCPIVHRQLIVWRSWKLAIIMSLAYMVPIVRPFGFPYRLSIHIPRQQQQQQQPRDVYLCMNKENEGHQHSALECAQGVLQDVDVPHRTEAGGYTHTTASKAKISAANKGKTPWNKGIQRSEEVRARIAEGVRRNNRQRFLQQLETLGLTEAQYEEKKQEEQRLQEEEKLKRKTVRGGYRATEETKAKISSILKEKYANGNITKRAYHGPFRKGFTHSEETKEKIRASLRKKWAEDPDYQNKMKTATSKNTNLHIRGKISQTLKEKWQDPNFRSKMIQSIQQRERKTSLSPTQKERISEAMKKKWQDSDFRFKAMMRRNGSTSTSSSRNTQGKDVDIINPMEDEPGLSSILSKKRMASVSKIISSESNGVIALTPLQPATPQRTSSSKSKPIVDRGMISTPPSPGNATTTSLSHGIQDNKKKKNRKSKQSSSPIVMVQALTPNSNKPLSIDMNEKLGRNPRLSDIGDSSSSSTTTTRVRVRQQDQDRRDSSLEAYLNHPDEERYDDDFIMDMYSITREVDPPTTSSSSSSKTLDRIFGGAEDDDDNLENFDPYGLDNF